jgi:hypothetical protein
MLTSRSEIAISLKVNETSVYRALKWLSDEQVIEQQTNNSGTIITLLNWEIYNGVNQDDEQKLNSKTNSECDSHCDSECDSPSRQEIKEVKEDNTSINKNINTGCSLNNTSINTTSSPISDNNNTSKSSISSSQKNSSKTSNKKSESQEPTWRTDINIYLKLVETARQEILNNPEEMKKQQDYAPGLNIPMTLDKAIHNFWGKKIGWDWKKKHVKETAEIDMYMTLINALYKQNNRVWKEQNKNVSLNSLDEQARRFLERHGYNE